MNTEIQGPWTHLVLPAFFSRVKRRLFPKCLLGPRATRTVYGPGRIYANNKCVRDNDVYTDSPLKPTNILYSTCLFYFFTFFIVSRDNVRPRIALHTIIHPRSTLNVIYTYASSGDCAEIHDKHI